MLLTEFTAPSLLSNIRRVFSQLPDARKIQTSNHLKYAMEDAALSAFSVFFTQSPSFLDYQKRMQLAYGKNNAQSIFGVHKIPSDNQVRNILDPIDPQHIFHLFATISDGLYQHGYFEPFRSVNQSVLIALDGVNFFSSTAISCANCCHWQHKNGKTSHHHSAITPVIVAPGQKQVIALPPEFIQPQDGAEKQDCELAASKRWLARWGSHYAPWRVTLLGDDLFSHQPFCQAAIAQGFDFILVCKPSSHALLYEWLDDFERNKQVNVVKRTVKKGKQRFTEQYRYFNQLPLRDSDDALLLNWCEVTVTNSQGKVTFTNAWVTTHWITEQNVMEIVAAARTRWKVENENNNVLKNHGYHFEHNFGHGKKHLSNLLATLILLAFLLHTVLDWFDAQYKAVRDLLPSRQTFFEHLRTLMLYLPFDDWQQLMDFMLSKLSKPITDSG